MKVDVLVVGAGFAGSVIAERCAKAGKQVLIVEKRSHIGGNAYDEYDRFGVLVHRYGPHIFHTNSLKVIDYLSQFTEWIDYEHRVLAVVKGEMYPIPINRLTINRLYGLSLTAGETEAYLTRVREVRNPVVTSEDVVMNSVGRDLCEKFFRGYTRKQWGLDLSELSATVAARIPVRCDDDDRYFTDSFQKMPAQGFTRMFERMLTHKEIRVEMNTDYALKRGKTESLVTVYTGPIDEFYDARFGALPYRSVRFMHEHKARLDRFQPVGTVNYPNDRDYTRITEFKHLTGQKHAGTSLVKEFPSASGDPYYPIPRAENQLLYEKYAALAVKEKNVWFVGRLAQYRYFNMDQVVAAALRAAEQILAHLRGKPQPGQRGSSVS